MKRGNVILFILVCWVNHILTGQRLEDWPIDDQLFFTINPAFTAQSTTINLGINHGSKWHQLKSSPKQSSIWFHSPFRNLKMGISARIFDETVGPFNSTGISFSYGYKIPVGVGGRDAVSIGLSTQLMRTNFDRSKLRPSDEFDVVISETEVNSFVPPSFAVGLLYQTSGTEGENPVEFYTGVSFQRFVPFKNRFDRLSVERLYQGHAIVGLKIWIDPAWQLEPGILGTVVEGSRWNFLTRLKTWYKERVWIMGQWSRNQYMTVQLGTSFPSPWAPESFFMISGSNSWYFGTVSQQLGNTIDFSLSYRKVLRNVR